MPQTRKLGGRKTEASTSRTEVRLQFGEAEETLTQVEIGCDLAVTGP